MGRPGRDHLKFQDDTVQPGTTYYYRVRAVDTAGQRGPFSLEASVRTKPAAAPGEKVTAQ
jgi:chitodextrinase